MAILVLVVTYNGEQWINKCINSLLQCSIDIHICIIDNNSTDNTVNIIKKKYPQVSIYNNNNNLGFGVANNIGLNLALKNNFDFVFLLNQDCWVADGCIELLVQLSHTNKEFGILSPIHMNAVGEKLDFGFVEYLKEVKDNKILHDIFTNKQMLEIYELPFVNAAAWLITRECLQKVGGFNPIFYHYGEDDNYCHRVNYHGLKIGIVPEVTVYHDREDRLNDKKWMSKWKNIQEVQKREFLIKVMNINTINNNSFFDLIKKITIYLTFFRFNDFLQNIKLLFFYITKYRKILKFKNESMEKKAFLDY